MSSSGGYGIALLAAAPLLAVLAAAGVAVAAGRGIWRLVQHHATQGALSLQELEVQVRGLAAQCRSQALDQYLAQPVPVLASGPNLSNSSSTVISEMAEMLARADAARAVLEHQPVLAAVAERWQDGLLAEAEAARREAAMLYAAGNSAGALERAAAAESRLTVAVHDAYERLARAEDTVVAQALSEVLEGRGYAVRQHADERGVALWAEHPERTLAVVASQGTVDVDMGASGLGCTFEVDAITQAMQERGFDMRLAHDTLHGRREGGALISAAAREARRNGMTMEHALLQRVQTQQPIDHDEGRRARARAFLWTTQSRAVS